MINVFGSDVGENEIRAVSEVMQSQWMGFGKKVEEFEQAFANHLNVFDFCMVDSGSNALYLAIKLLDLPAGSEVILPSFTWVSCAQAVLLNGLVPVFCDVDIQTMNVTNETIMAEISENTTALMVVHYAGLPVQMGTIKETWKAQGLSIIEDAAHAVDSKYKGKACGTLADVGIWSFDAVKNLTAGEGGGIWAADPDHMARAKMMRYCGIGKSGFDAAVSQAKNRWWEYNIQDVWIKMLPSNIGGAIALEQLKRLDVLQYRRQRIWETYQDAFEDIEQIITPSDEAIADKHSFFTYCIRVPERDNLARFLLDNGIYTTLRYHPLHMNKIYGQTGKRLPNSERLNESALSLPIHPGMSNDDIQKVVETVKGFYKR